MPRRLLAAGGRLQVADGRWQVVSRAGRLGLDGIGTDGLRAAGSACSHLAILWAGNDAPEKCSDPRPGERPAARGRCWNALPPCDPATARKHAGSARRSARPFNPSGPVGGTRRARQCRACVGTLEHGDRHSLLDPACPCILEAADLICDRDRDRLHDRVSRQAGRRGPPRIPMLVHLHSPRTGWSADPAPHPSIADPIAFTHSRGLVDPRIDAATRASSWRIRDDTVLKGAPPPQGPGAGRPGHCSFSCRVRVQSLSLLMRYQAQASKAAVLQVSASRGQCKMHGPSRRGPSTVPAHVSAG